jgi:hypothetical protein
MTYLLNHPWLFGLLIAISLAAMIELGQQIGAASRIQQETHRKEQTIAIRDGLFVLVSLLLGFTLALAVPRFTERRSRLVEEAVSIGATNLRAGLLPSPWRENARALLRKYADARIDLDDAGFDGTRSSDAANRSQVIQHQLWKDAEAVARTDRSAITATYVTSLNETIDLDEERLAAMENRIPISIWVLILSVSAIAILSRGLTLTRRFWLTLVLGPITIAIVLALVADLDSPSSGLLRLDNRAMQRLQAELGSEP